MKELISNYHIRSYTAMTADWLKTALERGETVISKDTRAIIISLRFEEAVDVEEMAQALKNKLKTDAEEERKRTEIFNIAKILTTEYSQTIKENILL